MAITAFSSIYLAHSWFLPNTPGGDPNNFNPITTFEDIKKFAGPNTQLISMEATFVNPTGNLNLNAEYSPSPNIVYKFVSEMATPPADEPPVGAGGKPNSKWYEPTNIKVYQPWQGGHVISYSGNGSLEYSYVNLGMQKDTDSPTNNLNEEIIEAPQCSFEKFWNIAIEKKAPTNSVATIKYDQNGYKFSIRDTGIELLFNKNCEFLSETKNSLNSDSKPIKAIQLQL